MVLSGWSERGDGVILLVITHFLLDVAVFIARQGDNRVILIIPTTFFLLLLVEENCITRTEAMIGVGLILMLKQN